MELKDAIRVIREGEKMSQQDFAGAIQVSMRTVSNWERGETTPHSGQLRRMATRLNADSWESLLARHAPSSRTPNGHGDMIPVLTTIPASFDCDGEVEGAYDFEAAIDHLPGTYRDASDPMTFGLRVSGDSMAPRYPNGCDVICSPKHWKDHGFKDGFCYAIMLNSGETTIKRVRLIDDGMELDLIPDNQAFATKRIAHGDVKHASLIRAKVVREAMPES